MTKRRAPLSIEQALQRIAGQMAGGVDGMAAAVTRQPGTVRAWMDPDRPEQVRIEAAITLDLAYQAEGGEGAPIYEAYLARLEVADNARFAEKHRLLEFTQGVVKEAGEACAALIALSCRDASETERRIAEREVAEAYEKIRDVRHMISPEVWGSAAAADDHPP